MAMQRLIAECLDATQPALAAEDLARACGESQAWVMELVDTAILQPVAGAAGGPRFALEALFVARRVRRLQRDLGLNLEGAALVLQLLGQIDDLRLRLRRAGLEA